MKTVIITIEGIDGSGKTVQFELIAKRLTELGFSVEKKSYPIYGSYFGARVGKYLTAADGVDATDVDQRSMALWFAMDRYMDFKGFCDGEYDFLLINRYVLSNAVYQSIREKDLGKPDIVDWVFELEYDVLGLPRPSLNLFFDVDTANASNNVEKKGYRDYVGSGKDVYEASTSIQQRARDKYREVAARYSDTAIINCTDTDGMLPPEKICDAVFEELNARNLLNLR